MERQRGGNRGGGEKINPKRVDRNLEGINIFLKKMEC